MKWIHSKSKRRRPGLWRDGVDGRDVAGVVVSGESRADRHVTARRRDLDAAPGQGPIAGPDAVLRARMSPEEDGLATAVADLGPVRPLTPSWGRQPRRRRRKGDDGT